MFYGIHWLNSPSTTRTADVDLEFDLPIQKRHYDSTRLTPIPAQNDYASRCQTAALRHILELFGSMDVVQLVAGFGLSL